MEEPEPEVQGASDAESQSASNQSGAPGGEEIVDKLRSKFAGEDGPLSDQDVADAVHEAADDLRDAPVQTFVPLITENVARNRLQDQVDEESDEP